MSEQELLQQVADVGARTVFGEPVQVDGVTVIPVARVRGGTGGAAGGGTSQEPAPEGPRQEGSGFGYGFGARQAGVYAVRDGQVTWHPALDVTRIVQGGQAVGALALLVVGLVVVARSRRPRR
ncbi:hypothetical protein [Quadrisphaera sp. DSM 44207]|uniref:hypothetical protein n=1 Tax=Quadrisphaera sp. DSM 44207 TaxID=1881057 RepID=UPI000889D09F|nr:hypothetical protein [Quadrisphaera sp. DSM 44207]SDQ07125.1 hypothetical protein SAMN05428996_0348 [Quadrisphaera sp. DSM 44207]